MSDLYNKTVMDHFMNPRNVGTIEDASGVGETGNPSCGDVMKMYIKVGKNKNGEDYIEDIKFQTFGCGAAVASSSMTTEMMKGKTITEAEKLMPGEVAEELGGLPPIKMHCSNLGAQALQAAIKDYKNRSK